MTTPFNNYPLAWIVEPVKEGMPPYLTYKLDVAQKREKAGDIVTPYYSRKSEKTE